MVKALRTLISDALVASAAMGIVYFSGWAFLSSYLNAFGIDPTQVSLPLTTVLVYAFRVLQSWWLIAGLCLAAVGVGFWVAYGKRLFAWLGCRRCVLPANLFITLMVAAGTLFAINWAAEIRALELARDVWLGNRPATVLLLTKTASEEESELADQYPNCVNAGLMRLIIGLPTKSFLLCPSPIQLCRRALVFSITDEGRVAAVTDWQRPSNTGEKRCEKSH